MKEINKKFRVVIDTNCILQILGAHSPYNIIWRSFLEERFTLCLSNDILNEYEEIISLKASSKAAYLFLQVLARSTNIIRKDPFFKFQLIEKDADDNKFVDCAIVCNADFIVSEDSHFKCLKDIPFPNVKVISLDEFLVIRKNDNLYD